MKKYTVRVLVVAVLCYFIIAFYGKARASEYDWEFKPYIKIGAGAKFKETQIEYNSGTTTTPYTDKDISARFEIGAVTGNWTYGLTHRSQWFQGYPFNDKHEYSVYEVFLDYTWWL